MTNFTAKDVDGNEIKVGDMVEVVDNNGSYESRVGSRLEVTSSVPYKPYVLLGFKGVSYRLYSIRVRKVNTNRHPHADLIIQWAEDTSLEFEQKVGDSDWEPLAGLRMMLDPRFLSREVRIKPSKTPAELEKESILASIKELEEKTATALSELQNKLKELEV